MPTRASVHSAIDALTQSTLSSYSVCFDNTDYEAYSQGSSPFISQKVSFRENNQLELGRTDMRRQHGKVIFLIHVRKGAGSSLRNTIAELLLDAFASKVIGGATFVDATELPLGESGNWAVTGIDIPFYYERLR